MEAQILTACRCRGRPVNDAPLREEGTNDKNHRRDVFNEHLGDKCRFWMKGGSDTRSR